MTCSKMTKWHEDVAVGVGFNTLWIILPATSGQSHVRLSLVKSVGLVFFVIISPKEIKNKNSSKCVKILLQDVGCLL